MAKARKQGVQADTNSADFDEVYSREIDEINKRRKKLDRPEIKPPVKAVLNRSFGGLLGSLFGGGAKKDEKPIYKRSVNANLVGLALSGGGIRSASFCLGAVQALEVEGAIKRVDLLSTVSGGGYTGASMTAAMTSGEGLFPFPSTLESDEPGPLKHIRDYSNFLIPNGWVDLLASGAIYLRGIVINIVVLLPWLLILAALTILCNPSRGDLLRPGVIANFILRLCNTALDAFHVPPLREQGFGAFTITVILLAVLILLLLAGGFHLIERVEAFCRKLNSDSKATDDPKNKKPRADAKKKESKSEKQRAFSETGSVWTRIIGVAFLITAVVAVCEFQTFVLDAKFKASDTTATLSAEIANSIVALVVSLGTIFGFFARTFESWIKSASQDPRRIKQLRAFVAKAAILIGAAVVPVLLWLGYFFLTYWGIADPSNIPAAKALHGLADWMIGGRELLVFIGARMGANWQVPLMYLLIAVGLLLVSHLLDPNRNSLHRLYRDRLSKAFLFDLSKYRLADTMREAMSRLFQVSEKPNILTRIWRYFTGEPERDDLAQNDFVKLSKLSAEHAPYHIINTALNIQNSKYVNRRGRNADFFILSPQFVGSAATRYVKTTDMESVHSDLDLATAMAISGAAISSNMGSSTIRPMTPTLTALNIRLGFWLRNPNWRDMHLSIVKRIVDWLNLYFFAEMFGLLREDSWRVYLTDGGHVENLGIYELLQRQCRLIIAVDAEADPEMNFPSFVKLQRYARIDLGVIIDLPWRRLRAVTKDVGSLIAKTGGPARAETRKGPHCVVGRIRYPTGFGYLVYVKSSLTGDENDYIQDYKRRYDRFPHETTGDQFFTEEQFEVYRALGFHAMSGFTNGNEEVPTYWDRIIERGNTPPMYARPSAPQNGQVIGTIRQLLGLRPLRRTRRRLARRRRR